MNNGQNFEYVDFHTHMHDEAFNIDSEEIMNQLIENKIACVTIGTDREESKKAKDLALKYQNIYYTVGLHPHDNLSATWKKEDYSSLITNKCIAIGECGLDYYYLNGDLTKGLITDVQKEKQRQKEVFVEHILLAKEFNLPLMIHGRTSTVTSMDAYEDILEILEKYYSYIDNTNEHIDSLRDSNKTNYEVANGKDVKSSKTNGNIHFFTGNIEVVQRFMNLGFTFSFGGVLTLTSDYDEVLRFIPIEFIHAETDSPYVVPKDVNGNKLGRRNSSLNIELIVAKIAEIKKIELQKVKEILLQNFKRSIN